MSYEELLTELAVNDERYIVMTAENRALIRNLPAKLGNRFVDTGITEQTMVGAAAGLAMRGRIPVLHALASFLSMRAFEFVRTDAGIPNLPVKLSAFIPGFLSDGNGATHQAIEDVAIMRGIPNVTVFAAADEQDLVGMIETIWNSPNPAYLRINTRKTDYQHTPFEIGKAEVISEGADVTILTYGLLFEQALIATQILKVAASSKLLVTLEDHFNTGGLYSIVAETLLKHGQSAKVMPYGLDKWFKPALLPEVLAYEGFTGKQIAEKILGYTTNAVQPTIVTPEFAE